MTLYKFKSLDQFEFVADILCNERFYAAKYTELNDPMEGVFDHDPDAKKEYLDKIIKGKDVIRILSLSKSFNNILLWAHYADSYSGICIEVEVQDSSNFEIVELDYSPFRTYFSNDQHEEVDNWPRYALRDKNEAWEYEEETRLLTRSEFLKDDIKITGILIGVRTPEVLVAAIKRLIGPDIPVYRTRICMDTNNIIKVD